MSFESPSSSRHAIVEILLAAGGEPQQHLNIGFFRVLGFDSIEFWHMCQTKMYPTHTHLMELGIEEQNSKKASPSSVRPSWNNDSSISCKMAIHSLMVRCLPVFHFINILSYYQVYDEGFSSFYLHLNHKMTCILERKEYSSCAQPLMESGFDEHRGRCPPYYVVHSQPSDQHRRAEMIELRHF